MYEEAVLMIGLGALIVAVAVLVERVGKAAMWLTLGRAAKSLTGKGIKLLELIEDRFLPKKHYCQVLGCSDEATCDASTRQIGSHMVISRICEGHRAELQKIVAKEVAQDMTIKELSRPTLTLEELRALSANMSRSVMVGGEDGADRKMIDALIEAETKRIHSREAATEEG